MTRKEWRKEYKKIIGNPNYMGEIWRNYREDIRVMTLPLLNGEVDRIKAMYEIWSASKEALAAAKEFFLPEEKKIGMTREEARIWYNHYFSGMNSFGFDTYYRVWKEWFDTHTLECGLNKQVYGQTLAPTTDCTQCIPVPCEQEKGNNPMYIDECSGFSRKVACNPQGAANVAVELKMSTPSDTAADQRKYLDRRVNDLRYTKEAEIAEQFHLHEPAGPSTLAELRERLKKGLYTVAKPKYGRYEDLDEDEDEIYWRDFFSWRTPETQYDEDGYEAAMKELREFIQGITDQIRILEPKETLSLLDDLKKWKPSKAKK